MTEIARATVDDADTIAELASRTFIEAYSANNIPAHVHQYAAAAFDRYLNQSNARHSRAV